MNNKILKKFAVAFLSVGMLASCSEDYLNTEPITAIPNTQVTSTVENAQMALYGVCRGMFNQYQSATQGYNGEACILMYNGEVPSQDFYHYQHAVGFPQLCNMEIFHETVSAYYAMFFPWAYGYTMINGANSVLNGIDNAEGDSTKRDFVKAQALTMRAHAYTRLLQLYAPRWVDSNNGEAKCLVLRTDVTSTGDSPLVSMNTILNLIYDDMNEAVRLMEQDDVKSFKRTFEWEPDYGVACGVFARAALLKNDWATAQTMAAKARTVYPTLMTNEEYHSGFCKKNQEWMWNSSGDIKDQIYYWSFGTQFACNGYYAINTDYGAGAANVLLLRQFPENDIRRQLFLVEGNYYTNSSGRETEVMSLKNWYNEDVIVPQNISVDNTKGKYVRTIKEFLAAKKPTSLPSTAPSAYISGAEAEAQPIFQYGGQIKFWVEDLPGVSAVCFMRASEMLLIEAEAIAMQGNNPAAAQALLNELNKERQPGYACTATGDELIEEVRKYRRLELWGEGFNFFDFKRWNIAIDRKMWVADDTESGNAPAQIAERIEPQDGNKWTYAVPRFETQYNLGIKEEPITGNNPQ